MVNSKKMNKSSVAIILLSLLLVLSLILTATGAWFTSADKSNTETLTFGEVTMDVSDVDITFVDASGASIGSRPVMPEDKIKINVQAVTKATGSEDFWYTIKVTIVNADTNSEVELGEDQLEALQALNTKLYCTKADATGADTLPEDGILVQLPGWVYGDDFEGEAFTISVEFRAVQYANVDATKAAELLGDEAGKAINWAVDHKGITKVPTGA